jgi:hypothetical protein
MGRVLTRRSFLALGAGAAAAVAVPARLLAASKAADIYKLEPGKPPVDKTPACHACVNHDTYSLFPSSKAADGNRAHIGCNCVVKKGQIDAGTYVALFGRADHLRAYRVDTRWPWVRAIIKQHPPAF